MRPSASVFLKNKPHMDPCAVQIFSNSVLNSRRFSNTKVVPRVLISHRNLFKDVSDSAEINSQENQTPRKFSSEGSDPRGNTFGGISDRAVLSMTFQKVVRACQLLKGHFFKIVCV
jgi:hypothetical protein